MIDQSNLPAPKRGGAPQIVVSAKRYQDRLEQLEAENKVQREKYRREKLGLERSLAMARSEDRRAQQAKDREEEQRLGSAIGVLVLRRIAQLGVKQLHFDEADLQILSDPEKLLLREYIDRQIDMNVRPKSDPGDGEIDVPI